MKQGAGSRVGRVGSKSGLIGLVMLLLASGTGRVAAQQTQQADPRLATLVHLDLGTTTVGTVTKALSEQTGLRIEASAYLQPRILITRLDNVSAETALDTLAELNDWRWFSPQAGRILLTRRRLPLPQQPADVPAAVQSALPVDIRRFFGIGVSIAEVPVFDKKNFLESQVKFDHPWEIDQTRRERMASKLRSLAPNQPMYFLPPKGSNLLEVEAGKYEGPKEYYAQLAPRQQDALLLWLLLPVCEGTNLDALLGTLMPFIHDLNTARFEMNNGMLLVNARILYDNGRMTYLQGFGAPLPENSSPKPP